MSTESFFQANQALWNQWTPLHEQSDFYALERFKAGESRLRPIERAELTDVAGKSLLHLQCHFGLDTLSWARKGAIVTGVDISDVSIQLASNISAELGIPATFIASPIDDLPQVLNGSFDIVFTSYGVLHWLPDISHWAHVVSHFLKPGGIFYIVEDHPCMRIFSSDGMNPLRPLNSYFHSPEPSKIEARGSYAAQARDDTPLQEAYIWNHSLGEIITALISAGLTIEFLHEFPFAMRQKFPMMVQDQEGLWRMPRELDGTIPFLFSLRARKSAA